MRRPASSAFSTRNPTSRLGTTKPIAFVTGRVKILQISERGLGGSDFQAAIWLTCSDSYSLSRDFLDLACAAVRRPV
jgi:hypothetical protein